MINDVQFIKSYNYNGLYGDRKIDYTNFGKNDTFYQFEDEQLNKNKIIDDVYIFSDLITKSEMIN